MQQYPLIIEDRNGVIADELTFERGSYTLGRSENNDIQLNSNAVSRNHARVFTDGTHCYVEDLNSSNGVFVDGNRIFGSSEIVAGSQIRIGDYLLLLQTREQRPAPAAPQPSAAPFRQQHSGAIGFARLIRLGDVLEGETFSLTELENTVGRTEDNTILLSDPSVSRQHSKIVLDQGRYVVIDLGSSNGTRVNAHLITQPSLINPSDIVRFGNVRFVFAAPGQHVDLREFNRYLSGSNRGLVLAVMVLALMLILVASGIGAFVLIEKSRGDDDGKETPVLENDQMALDLRAEGDALAAEERWNEAIVKYRLALDYDPNLTDVAQSLARAESEFNTSRMVREASMTIQSGDDMVRAGNLENAISVFLQARLRLEQVPETSRYRAAAQSTISTRIDPAMVDIYRQMAQRELEAQDFPGAIGHYDQILEILEANPGSEMPGVGDDVRRNLWSALVSAADRASENRQYQSAVTFYERAGTLGELPAEVERRLNRARSRL